MANYVLKGGQIVNEGKIFQGDIRIKHGRIDKIASLFPQMPRTK